MRYPPEHKIQARRQLLKAGAALAKQQGFANTGMDALTAAAGVTTGAFYTQFTSKADFLHAIIEQELTQVVANFAHKTPQELQQVLSMYLSVWHVQHPEKGCPIPALGAEIGRADERSKTEFEQHLDSLMEIIHAAVGNREQAWALLAQAVGAIVLARAVADPAKQHEIVQSVLQHSLSLISSAEHLT
jgi:AcrR family transcriptional regulator